MISFRPAIREKTPLMLGIAGPSRSGKTYSALRIATGLAQGAPIAGIDTESGRMLQYAGRFKFQHGLLTAPFTAERYGESIKAAMELKPAVIICDSFSHLHEGPGGILEQHEKELDRMAGTDYKRREKLTFAAWIKPKHAVNLLVNEILQTPVHFIFCFRAKKKLKIQAGKDPIELGWTPIITDRFEYECSMLLVLPEGSQGRPDLEAVSAGLRDPFQDFVKPGQQLDEKLGASLAEWSAGGAGTRQPVTDAPVLLTAPERKALIEAARKAGHQDEDVSAWLLWKYNAASTKELRHDQYGEIMRRLEHEMPLRLEMAEAGESS